jgi:ankyrin repeat protein
LENNADAWLGNRESNGPTILHRICRRELLSQPMNPAFVGDTGMPILHAPPNSLASDIFYHEKSDKLYALITRQPALLNARDRNGCTCLHIAIEGADLAAVEILLHGGADKFLCDNSGLKPLEFLGFVWERTKKWRGGYSAGLGGIFDEIYHLLQD